MATLAQDTNLPSFICQSVPMPFYLSVGYIIFACSASATVSKLKHRPRHWRFRWGGSAVGCARGQTKTIHGQT